MIDIREFKLKPIIATVELVGSRQPDVAARSKATGAKTNLREVSQSLGQYNCSSFA